ncbi:hypothetical protein M0804_003118 [Polistes exclamans]|nr:hypothetical protein M0804_003118 [Polistes exclamans]
MDQKFENNQMNVSKPDLLTIDGMPHPYVLVGDETFQLTNYLLRSYPGGSGFDQERMSLWRILKKPIKANVDNTVSMIQAIICLHNWFCKDNKDSLYIPPNLVDQEIVHNFIPGAWRDEVNNSILIDRRIHGNNFSSRSALPVRDDFCEYF